MTMHAQEPTAVSDATDCPEAVTKIPAASLVTALRSERAGRKQAERELREYRAKYHEAKDRAELWEYRAKRYSDTTKTLRIKLASTNPKK